MNNKEIWEKASFRPKKVSKTFFWFDPACHIIATSQTPRSTSYFMELLTLSSLDKHDFLSKKVLKCIGENKIMENILCHNLRDHRPLPGEDIQLCINQTALHNITESQSQRIS